MYALGSSAVACGALRYVTASMNDGPRSEEHTSELQSRQYLPSFPTRRSSGLHGLRSLVANLLRELVAEDGGAAEITLVATDALALPLLFDTREVDVRAGIVRRRVRRAPIRDRLDERRSEIGRAHV